MIDSFFVQMTPEKMNSNAYDLPSLLDLQSITKFAYVEDWEAAGKV